MDTDSFFTVPYALEFTQFALNQPTELGRCRPHAASLFGYSFRPPDFWISAVVLRIGRTNRFDFKREFLQISIQRVFWAMGAVTAVKMDVVTQKSGHQVTGMAVSVCTTPAAPSPIPIPYPTMGASAEGIILAPMRTKIQGSPILNVGGAVKCCHGNEPGTLKEVVSLTTGGAMFPLIGAPVVLVERGMTGITGSTGLI
ncbi:MAG TPA: PAAR-like domain-containing protein, partial [Polyangiaceae bacterium]|nr:PAAR-like domain-containing protein [Polyangiaceae bacterium]